MAALSVQSRREGTKSSQPRSPHSPASASRRGVLAATPPVKTMRRTPSESPARTVLRTSILTTVAWNEAATSATCAGERAPARRTCSDTAVLIPLKEKSGAPSVICAVGSRRAAGFPSRAMRSMAGPPG